LLCAIAIVCPTRAWAANTTITTAIPLAFGQVYTQFLSPSTPAYFSFYARAGRSYSAFCLSTVEGAAAPGIENNSCGTFEARNSSDTAIASGVAFGGDVHFPGGQSWGYVAGASGLTFVRASTGFTLTVRIVIFETTLYSPWFFVSQAAGYDAYVEIRNTTSLPLSVTVTAQALDGSTLGSVTRTVPADGGTAVAIGADMAITIGSGSVRIAHNGIAGSLVANVTTLSGITGLSFDSPATPRMVWSTFP
jgi:hypothetical protein